MNISEPAAMAQERAVLRGFAARSLVCACLIAVALASQDAVAQKPPIEVRLLPGETTRTLVAPSGPSFNVLYVASEEYVCNLPTAARINDLLQTWARAGSLQQTLTSLESPGTATSVSIWQAYQEMVDVMVDGKTPSGYSRIFSSGTLTSSPKALGNSGFTHTFAANCLTVPEARAGIKDIRRIVRAYLGLPAPAN